MIAFCELGNTPDRPRGGIKCAFLVQGRYITGPELEAYIDEGTEPIFDGLEEAEIAKIKSGIENLREVIDTSDGQRRRDVLIHCGYYPGVSSNLFRRNAVVIIDVPEDKLDQLNRVYKPHEGLPELPPVNKWGVDLDDPRFDERIKAIWADPEAYCSPQNHLPGWDDANCIVFTDLIHLDTEARRLEIRLAGESGRKLAWVKAKVEDVGG